MDVGRRRSGREDARAKLGQRGFFRSALTCPSLGVCAIRLDRIAYNSAGAVGLELIRDDAPLGPERQLPSTSEEFHEHIGCDNEAGEEADNRTQQCQGCDRKCIAAAMPRPDSKTCSAQDRGSQSHCGECRPECEPTLHGFVDLYFHRKRLKS